MIHQTKSGRQHLLTPSSNVRPMWAYRFVRTAGTSLLFLPTFVKWYLLITFIVYATCRSVGLDESLSFVIGGLLGVGSEFFRRSVRESLINSPYRLRDMGIEEAKQTRWARGEWGFAVTLIVAATAAGFASAPGARWEVASISAILTMALATFLIGLRRLLAHFVREFRVRMDAL